MEDVAQSAGTECQVQSCDHIFGFNNANNFADLAALIDNVKLKSVLDHYGVLIACDKLVGNLVKGNGLCSLVDSGAGQGGGRPGEKGAGGVREAGEEGAGSGIPKVAGSGRKREKLRNIAQYFAIKKMQRGGSQKIQGGNRD